MILHLPIPHWSVVKIFFTFYRAHHSFTVVLCAYYWNNLQSASYQILNIAGCARAGNAGSVFRRRQLQRKPLVSDSGMHHGTCVTHVPWCMAGSLASGGGENVPGIPGACTPAIFRIWQEAHTNRCSWRKQCVTRISYTATYPPFSVGHYCVYAVKVNRSYVPLPRIKYFDTMNAFCNCFEVCMLCVHIIYSNALSFITVNHFY